VLMMPVLMLLLVLVLVRPRSEQRNLSTPSA
jgi:hypothetical protein